nr:hypothetical protein HmN_000996800 [Hymenolepis microstoma]
MTVLLKISVSNIGDVLQLAFVEVGRTLTLFRKFNSYVLGVRGSYFPGNFPSLPLTLPCRYSMVRESPPFIRFRRLSSCSCLRERSYVWLCLLGAENQLVIWIASSAKGV